MRHAGPDRRRGRRLHPNGTNTQLDITDTSDRPDLVSSTLLLEDQNDTVNFTNNLANGLGAVSIVGGAGSETVTLNATTLAGNLGLDVEVVTVAAGANVNVGTNAITAGGSNVTFSGASTVTAASLAAGTLNIGAGTVNLIADTTAGTLNLSGTGVLSGSGDVTLNGTTNSSWTTGTYTGTGQLIVSSGHQLTLSGSAQRAFGTGTLVNEGTVLWTGGNIDVIGNGTVVNRGLFDIQANGGNFGDSSAGVGTLTFNNELGATLRKNGAAGVVTALGSSGAVGGTPNGVNLTNAGTIDVQTGTLSINHSFAGLPTGTSTGSGIFAVAAGAALQFGTTNTLTASSVVSGAGTVAVQHGNFSTAGTWSHTGTLAVNGGIATFTPVGAFAPGSITVAGGAGTFNSAATTGTLAVSGGTATFTAPVSATTLALSGGTLTGTANVTLTGASSSWTTGAYTGTGQLIVSSGHTLTLSGSTQRAFGAGTLVNDGTVLWTGGHIDVVGNGTVVNRSLFEVQGGSVTFGDQGTGVGTLTFNNEVGATLRKSVAGGLTSLGSSGGGTPNGVNLTNAGTVDVQTGTLSINHSFSGVPVGNSTASGTFAVAAGAALQFGATNTLTSTSTVSGAGAVSVQHGTFSTVGTWSNTGALAVNGGSATFTPNTSIVAFTPGSITVAGGTGTFNSAVTTGPLAVSAGTATFNAAASATTLSLSGGTLTASGNVSVTGAATQSGGTLAGGGNVTVSGATTLSGGTMTGSGDTITLGALTINLNGTNLDAGRLLDVRAGATWSAGSINLNSNSVPGSGTIINRAGSVFDNTFNGSMVTQNFGVGDNGADALFTNLGTFRKSGGVLPGESSIGNVFDNSGAVEVQSGRLNLSGGGTHTGSFSGTGTLQFGGGTHALSATTSITTANANFSAGTANVGGTYNITGTTLVNGGTANFTGTLASLGNTLNITAGAANVGGADATVTTFTQSGGTLSGTGDLTVSGTTTLSAGSMTGSGSTITLGALTINLNGTNLDAGRLLDVRAGAIWSAGGINLNSASVPGSGSIINRAGSVFENSFNGGMFTQNLGAADNGTDALFTNLGTFRKSGGVLPGETTIGNAFDNSGTVEVQSGRLNVTGTLLQTGTVDVASGATFRKLGSFTSTSTGTLSGSGTFDVGSGNTLTNAGTIAPGTSPGLLTFIGNLLLTDTSVINFELAGDVTRGTDYDAFNVTGNASLAGAANIFHLGGFVPTLDDGFRVIEITPSTSGNVTGTFASVNSPAGFTYDTVYGADDVTFHLADNQPPVANNDSATTNEDFAVTIAVRSNDTDVENNALTVSQFTQGANGMVTLNGSGNLIYTPNANFFGSDTFTYRVTDTGLLESNQATVTVTVAPVADFSVAFLTPTGSVGEGAGAAALTLVLTTDTALNSNVMVDLTDPGTGSAVLGADYTFTNPTTLTFLAGSLTGATQSAAVAITNERSVETIVETADFSFGNIRAVGLGVNVGPTTGAHTLSITDNDSAAVAITAPGTTSVTEGGSSANVGVTLTLTTDGTVGTAQLDVQVLATLPRNGDYTTSAAVFGVGSLNGDTANVVVTALDDRRVEQATESFAGRELSATSTASVSASTSQTIQVLDNDSASVAITTPGTTTVTEGGGSAEVGVTLTLTSVGIGTEQLDVEVSVSLPGNGDYEASAVAFGVNTVSGATDSVMVVAVNDRRVEQLTESFIGQALSATSMASVSASTSQTIEVTDNDSASVAITAPGTTNVTEGGASANVGVTLTLITDGTGTEQLDVEVAATLPGNLDYAAAAAVFGVGAISGATADVVVSAVNDLNVEQILESFPGQALSVTSTASASASTSQTINVTDNDSASVAITAPGTTSVTEGGASANVGVTLLLTTDGTVGTAQLDVAVSATLPGNADYAATDAIFAAGAVSGATADLVVSAVNDRNVEQAIETFSGQALGVVSAANASASTSQTIEVTDNDSASVAITAPGTTSLTEGGAAANLGVTLTLTTDGTVGAAQLDVAVSATLPGNADYAVTDAIFAVGAVSGATADLVVSALNDRNVEQAIESFPGQALGASSTASVSATTSQVIEVTDNDSASVAITAPGTTSVTEGGASANVGVTLLLTTDGTVGTAQLDVAVSATLAGNLDYAAAAAVFAVGAVSGAVADVVVSAVNDLNVEQATESFAGQALSVTSTASASASTSQTIAVTDNDSASVAITTPGTTSLTEGGVSANVGVTLLLTTDGTVGTAQVDVEVSATLAGNADYAATGIVFAAGAVSGATADVMVSAVNDRNVEQAIETFAGQALSVTSTASASASTSQTIEVTDNDSASVAITTPGTTSVTEGGASANVGVTLTLITDGTGTEQLDVEVAATLPGNADYAVADAVFGVGALSGATADLVVSAVNDRNVEQAIESFSAQALGAISTASVSASTSQTISVVDNDSASVAITTPGTTSVTEGGASANVGVTLLLTTDGTAGTAQLDVAVSATLPGNADYAAMAAVFAAGAISGATADVVVSAVNDVVVEQAVESFGGQALSVTSMASASASTSQTIEVTDNDTAIYTINDVTVSEAAGTLTFTVSVSNPVDIPVTINVNYADQTATGAAGGIGADYDNGQDQVVFAALDMADKEVTVAITNDSIVEAAETFLASLTTPTNLAGRSVDTTDTGIGTIANDDANNAPVAVDDAYTTNEDMQLIVSAPGVLANDTDAELDTLTAALVTGPAHGTLIFGADGGFTYTPELNYFGGDSFTYQVSDGALDSNIATVTLTVNAVNDAPDAQDDAFTTDEDTVLTVPMPGVLANDTDIDSTLTAVVATGPANGTLVFNADGSFTYTPNLNFNGSDSFTYRASDAPGSESNLATVLLTVNAVNDAPVAVNDAYTTDEDTVLTVLVPGVLANDTDVDSAALTAVVATGPANGTLVLNADGSFTYTSNLNFNGSDSFTYRASDAPGSESNLATVLLTVNAVNDAPDAQDDTYTVLEDVVLMVDAPGVLGNDSDVDSALTAAVVDDVDHGTLSLAADGSFFYAADLNFFGTDTFIYEVSDGQGGTDTATVTITIVADNDDPVAVDDSASTAEDVAVSIAVLANDTDVENDLLFVTDVGLAANGTVAFSGGAVIYTPNLNFHGIDTFEYTVSDGEDIDTGLVTVTVTPVNDSPVAVDDVATTDEEVAVTIAVLANDQDVDGDSLIVDGVTQGANGTVTFSAGAVIYTPHAGFSGTDFFDYTVSDGQGGNDIGRVTVTVDEADDNDAPVFVEIADRTITEGQELRFTVSAVDPDHPETSLIYTATSLPAGATFDEDTQEFVWIPADNAIATVTFTVLDPEGATDTMEVVLTATNVAATVNAGADQVVGLQKKHGHDHDDDDHHGYGHHHHKKGEATVSIAATFNDRGTLDTHANMNTTIDWGDGDVTTGTVSESPFGPPGSTAGANGTVTGTHTYKRTGVYTVTVTVTDDDGASRSDTLTVTVKDPDKHLKARDDEYELREDGVLQVNAAHGVLRNDRAPGSLPLTARLVEGPDHGALTFNTDGSFTYRPDANFHGQDSFWYEFTDGTNVSKAVQVELNVKSDGRHEACIDWGGHGGWGHFGGGKHANFAEFLIKLARKFN